MKGRVSWVVECAVNEGQLGTFEELMGEMVTGTSAEPGYSLGNRLASPRP
jgi:quinol monooxygenase YgiN